MRRFARIISVVMAMTVAFSAMPLGVSAACVNHDPVRDGGGNIVFYVDANEHYNICEACYDEYGRTPHNNSNDQCTDCGVTLDAGTSTHTHNVTPGQYGFKNKFGHTVVCADNRCVGLFETHTNMNGVDANGDGTSDCDYCGWDGLVVGKGGGGSSDGQGGNECQHTPRYRNDGVPEYGTDSNEHAFICDICEQPFNFQPHVDADGNGKCDDCDFGECNHTPKYHDNGVPEYGVNDDAHYNICDICGDSYNGQPHVDADGSGKCDICDFGECNHTPKYHDNGVPEYGVNDDAHYNICTICGDSYNGQPHVDDDGSGKCDICDFGECNHTPKYHDNGVPEYSVSDDAHYNICDICGDQYNGQPHVDDDGSGKCDDCDFGECNHTPRQDSDGNIEYGSDDDNHGMLCDRCGNLFDIQPHRPQHNEEGNVMYAISEDNHTNICEVCYNGYNTQPHSDTDGNGRCDMCNFGECTNHTPLLNSDDSITYIPGTDKHYKACIECGNHYDGEGHVNDDGNDMCDMCCIPIVADGNGWIHNHHPHPGGLFANRENHFNRCDTCGMTEFNISAHIDTDKDSRCDICDVSVDAECIHQCQTIVTVAKSEEHHSEMCPECKAEGPFENHKDDDNNDKCDACNATLDENDRHIHQPDGRWQEMNDEEHGCECTECDDKALEPHTDVMNNGDKTANPDKLCDKCDFWMGNSDGSCGHNPRHAWWDTTETVHALHCGDCGEQVEPAVEHNDSNSDGKCDVCLVGVVNNIHTHTWATTYSHNNDSSEHFFDCTDSNCTRSTESGGHCDIDGDNKCDVCQTARRQGSDWCTEHWPSGEMRTDANKHYNVCGNCNNRFDGEKHVTDDQWWICTSGNGHKYLCVICYEPAGTEKKHTNTNDDTVCDQCGVEVNKNAVHKHISDGLSVEGEQHFNRCDNCGQALPNTKEWHADRDNNGKCDVCKATVSDYNWHDHIEKLIKFNNEHHMAQCADCGTEMYGEEHWDNNGDSVCDGCHESYITIKISLASAEHKYLKSKLEAAVKNYLNGNGSSGFAAFFREIPEGENLAETYKDVKAQNSSAYLDFAFNTWVHLEEEQGDDPQVKVFYDNARKAVNGGKLRKLFTFDIMAAIMEGDGFTGWSCSNHYSNGKLSYVAKIDAADVKADRVWYVYATEDGTEYKKVGETAKGASEITFTVDSNDYIFALISSEGVSLKAPTNVKATNDAATGKPVISWSKVSGAVKYQVWRSTAQNGTYGLMGTYTDTTMTNKNAVAGKLYYYKVVAVDANGNKSAASAVVQRTADLAKVTGVKATNDAATGKPVISWNKVDGATGYKVYRSTAQNGTYGLMGTYTGTTMTNKNAVAGKLYYYKVMAVHSNANANSAYSAVVQRTADLAQVTNLKITNDAATGKPKLTWNAVEGAVSYKVYRSTAQNGTYSLMGTYTGTTMTNKNAVAGKTYYYKVMAVHSNANANGVYSAVASRMCDLARPTVTVKIGTTGKPVLSWNKVDGAVKYQIYRSTAQNGTYTLINTVTGTSTTNKNAVKGKKYFYKVVAVHSNTNANSAYSTVVSITSK